MSHAHFEGSPPPAGLPPSGRAFGPILWEVIERWHDQETAITDWSSACRQVTPRHDGWAGLAERLQLINTYQWHQEDLSRDPQAPASLLAAVKRAIDASNERRVRAVEALDDLLLSRFQEGGHLAPGAPLHSESPGSIVDRLSVLALKVYHVRQALTTARQRTSQVPSVPPESGRRPGPPGGPELPPLGHQAADPLAQGIADSRLASLVERLRALTEQLADLTGCLDRLLRDLWDGRVRVKLYRQIKIYREGSADIAPENHD